MRRSGLVGVAAAVLIAGSAVVPHGPQAFSAPISGTSAAAGVTAVASAGNHHDSRPGRDRAALGRYKRIVVIYQENHSFDNLFGAWGSVDGERVEGVDQADPAHATQVAQNSSPLSCLPQNDVNLASPPQAVSCIDAARSITSAFENRPFTIDDYIKPADNTCPAEGVSAPFGVLEDSPGALTGGCTRDLVHRFYQEKYQIDHGKQDRYLIGSDAIGLTMGVYDTKQLPIYTYLHDSGAPNYVIADRFFQGANGGSFLNHQWLIAGRAPYVDQTGEIPGTARPVNSIVDSNGMPTSYPFYVATGPVLDRQLTVACPPSADRADPADTENYRLGCGNFAVNTVQPASRPYNANGPFMPLIDDEKYPNIGDRLTDRGISWAWYSGGWDAAEAGAPGKLFQYHHQPFNYFKAYSAGQPGRHHLQDETDFIDAARIGNLPTVSFVKPYGAENEHPGYASATSGSKHLVDLIDAVVTGPQGKDTLVIVTYDEFGGQWDHVSPPGRGSPTKGAYDAFGPGTRIPALLVSAGMTSSGVDHTSYDTTSILTTLEHAFGLAPVGIRDTKVNDLRKAVRVGSR